MSTVRDLNVKLAHAIGLSDLRNIRGFELKCWYDEVPTLKITTLLLDGASISEDDRQFLVVPLNEPFDIDKACERAMQRVNRSIEASADRALKTISRWKS